MNSLRAISIWIITVLAVLSPAAAQEAQRVEVPSGGSVSVFELLNPKHGMLYVSFLAPQLSGADGLSYDVAQGDMDELCALVGLPEAEAQDDEITEIVIRLMAAPIAYGEANQEIAQFASVYDVTSGGCEWM